ncbi:cytochrome c oxidase cbb3-type subunit 4 [Natronocella acetinitrilica]|uniref:Cytochrome c oxidase cbb3-type subunit 4 n=1 Tax=Natronocella acetinitrilica TaxID=414046 RepID=A0AAE3KBC9_9GAMM|nr:cbb3-type cytochrome c oxidase subunit 3 [Natronocella acetinitrilica]MCP1674659.1 cytochrome c oxidase cbb3-type subunit 4 [Natronocella acetinitrilica]
MDVNTFYGLITLVLMILFGGIVFWAYSGKRKQSFDEAAQLPLEENRDKPARQSEGRGNE